MFRIRDSAVEEAVISLVGKEKLQEAIDYCLDNAHGYVKVASSDEIEVCFPRSHLCQCNEKGEKLAPPVSDSRNLIDLIKEYNNAVRKSAG